MNTNTIRLMFATAASAVLISFVGGCNSGTDPELESARAEAARLANELESAKADVEKLQEENQKLELSKLETANQQMKEKFANDNQKQQELTQLKSENRQLTGQVEALQRSLEGVKEELVNVSRRPVKSQKRTDTVGATGDGTPPLAVKLKPLPEVVKEDGKQCKECTNAKLGTLKNGRLVACSAVMCTDGFLRKRVPKVPGSKTKILVRFPCPTCLGFTKVPCGTCREKDHKFGLNQQYVIAEYLKKGKILWIEGLSFTRDLSSARGRFSRAKTGSSEARSARSDIDRITLKIENHRKKHLENNYAIVGVFRQQLELLLRNVPRSEQPVLRDKAIKAIDLFSEAYVKGYYY